MTGDARNWVSGIPTAEAYPINRILHRVQHDRAEEARFFADPAAYIAAQDNLTPRAADALVRTDIAALYQMGTNPYLLRAYCLQLRVDEQVYLGALRALLPEGTAHG